MAKPPKLPINGEKDYFDILVEDLSPLYKTINIELTFDGFKDTIKQYSELTESNYNKSWEIGKELLLWSEYMSNIYSYNEKLLLDSETDKKKEYAVASSRVDGAVSKGDREADKDEIVVNSRKRRNALKAFSTALEKKIDFCTTSYHLCKFTCQWNSQTSNGHNIPI